MATKAVMMAAAEGEQLRVLGTEMLVKVSADDTAGAYEVVVEHPQRGGEIVPHRHPWEEFYFMLAGTMEVQVGGRRRVVTTGDFVTIPPKALHGFSALTDDARFLHISMGTGAVRAFREFSAEVPHRPGLTDLGAVMEINARHQIEVVVPDGFIEAMLAAEA